MLECEWTNPGAMLLSPAEEGAAMDQPLHLRHPIFPLYDRGGLEFPCMFSPFPSPAPPPPAAAVASPEDYSFHRYGLPLPPAAAVDPPAGPPMRIGLNLGVRTYFSSTPDGELMRLGSNVYRRSSGGTAAAAAAAGGGLFGTTSCDGGRCSSAVRCQAEGCGADLARAKHYHRRHKVCEFHSKAAAAVVHGLTQRFCQQCSRFHVLSEFDQGKRSCRKRLAEHNRRRRKTHQPAASLPPPPPQQQPNHSAASAGNFAAVRSSTEGAPPGKFVGAATPPSPTRMALGRCLAQPDGFPGANSSTSSSPSSRSSSNSVLPHASDFRPYGHRLPISMWDADAEPEYAAK